MGQITQTIIVTVVSVGIPAFFGFLGRQLYRRRRGRLVRFDKEQAAQNARELESTQKSAYIQKLREQAISKGYKPLNYPRGLKPKD